MCRCMKRYLSYAIEKIFYVFPGCRLLFSVRDSSVLHDFLCHANCTPGTKVKILTRRGEKAAAQIQDLRRW